MNECRILRIVIDFKECHNPENIPFQDESFDLIINRHGNFNTKEIYHLLKKKVGLFITDQVGEDNEAARKFYESIGFVDTGKS